MLHPRATLPIVSDWKDALSAVEVKLDLQTKCPVMGNFTDEGPQITTRVRSSTLAQSSYLSLASPPLPGRFPGIPPAFLPRHSSAKPVYD